MHNPGSYIEYVLIFCFIFYSFSGFQSRKRLKKIVQIFFEGILILLGITCIGNCLQNTVLISFIPGVLYLPVMILMTSNQAIRDFGRAMRFPRMKNINYRDIGHIVSILSISMIEELIWRVAYVCLLRKLNIQEMIIILTGAILFTIAHWSKDKRPVLREQAEFFLFSVMLYIIFIVYESLISVWLIHASRNIIIKNISKI